MEGIFVSDCGILFACLNGQGHDFQTLQDALCNMLNIIEKISKDMINYDIMLTASIAYGEFDYRGRDENRSIQKHLLFGEAYLNAYLDNEHGEPKLKPGQCRSLIENKDNLLPNGVNDALPKEFWESILKSEEDPFNRIGKNNKDPDHLYFYWMVSGKDKIEDFDSQYEKASNKKKYENAMYKKMRSVLKQFSKLAD